MLNLKSFLAVDFGAGSLKLAEFEVSESGGLLLKQFSIKPLGSEGSQDAKREALILKVLQETITEKGIKAKDVNVCAPGFHVFSKFVKLPPVDPGKVTQMIQYEAQQNVPFPLAEVVWDYQILGSTSTGELEVLLVAIKSDIVEGLFRTAESASLRLQLCDVSTAALCNAFRYNYGDLEDCTMLLDIGAKTSNLLFFEKGKVFSRSINLGANSITQDFANESKLKFDEAEKNKIEQGFVSLGGAYEEPENKYQAAISKIARQFMTKLHIQVNQTMQFYRGQQGGSAPQRLFLAGGASIMPYTAQFFAEKLNVPVEYFNPFRNAQIDPSVNLEELARVAHSLGEVVGLGLRNLAHCPIELNLMPESTLRWQSFNQKKPYFIATVFIIVAMAFAVGFLFERLAKVKQEQLQQNQAVLGPLQAREQRFNKAYEDFKKTQSDLDQLTTWIESRYHWADVCLELRQVLIRAELNAKRQLGFDTGVWVEELRSGDPTRPVETTGLGEAMPRGTEFDSPYRQPYGQQPYGQQPYGQMPYGQQPYGQQAMPQPVETPPVDPNAPAAAPLPEATIKILCRGVNLGQQVSPEANTILAFAVQTELQASPMFDPTQTKFDGQITVDETTGTFTFPVTLVLKKPLKL
jgi:type IV pilus assembly protein PilM